MLTKCFEYGKLLSVWLKAIVTPIPKCSTKDPKSSAICPTKLQRDQFALMCM